LISSGKGGGEAGERPERHQVTVLVIVQKPCMLPKWKTSSCSLEIGPHRHRLQHHPRGDGEHHDERHIEQVRRFAATSACWRYSVCPRRKGQCDSPASVPNKRKADDPRRHKLHHADAEIADARLNRQRRTLQPLREKQAGRRHKRTEITAAQTRQKR
jgi:hypothetical protein